MFWIELLLVSSIIRWLMLMFRLLVGVMLYFSVWM